MSNNFIWIFLFLLVCSCAQPDQKQIDSMLENAKVLKSNGENTSAVKIYSEILSLDPKNTKALLSRSYCFGLQKDYKNAMDDANNAILSDPKSEMAIFNRAGLHMQMKEYSKAIADYSTLIDKHSNLPNLHRYRAHAYRDCNKYELAITDFLNTIESDTTKNYKMYLDLGDLYYRLGQLDKSLAAYSSAISADPGHAEYYNLRAVDYQINKNYEQAIKDYTTAISLEKQFNYFTSRAYCYYNSGLKDSAFADVNKSIELRPDSNYAYCMKGKILTDWGRYKEAITAFNADLNFFPQTGYVILQRGLAFKAWRKLDLAKKDFMEAINLGYEEEAKQELSKIR
jgi:tetratricopeptide (TPR) repeat protein